MVVAELKPSSLYLITPPVAAPAPSGRPPPGPPASTPLSTSTLSTCSFPAAPSSSARLLEHAREKIAPITLLPLLLLITFGCGLLDAVTYADLAVFASNQTGNTLILTLLATGVPTTSHLYPTLASLLSFLVFGFAFGQIGHLAGPRRRAWITASCTAQLVLLLIPTLLVSTRTIRLEGGGAEFAWLLVGLLGASSGAQVAMCRNCSIPECPSAMLTSPFIDLFTDASFFVGVRDPKGRARNIRVAYVSALIGGSFLGAGVRKTAGSEATLWIGVVLKMLVVGWAVVLKGEPKEEAKKLSPC